MGTGGDGARAEVVVFLPEGWRGAKTQVSQETCSKLPGESELPKPGVNVPAYQGEGQFGGLTGENPLSVCVQSCLFTLVLCIQM